MWKVILLLAVVIGLTLFAIYWPFKQPPKLTTPSEPHVLLVMVDSLMSEPLRTLMDQGELPGFSFLYKHGFMSELTSTFPTMSVVNDSSLLTGTYPDEHGIPGLVWFKSDEDRFVDYGDATGNIIRQGPLKVAQDGVFHLNEEHLSPEVETIHEYLAERGVSSASINLMVRRGPFKHAMRFPFNHLFGNREMSGPDVLRNGFFLKKSPPYSFPTPFNKYGFGNKQVERMTLDLMQQANPPRLLITYLSDSDKMIHKYGPAIKKPLYEADRFIQHILGSFSNEREALKNWRIIVMGDSGQARVRNDEQEALISIPDLLPQYALRGLGKHPSEVDLAVAANERMSYLYPLKQALDRERLAARVIEDPRVEMVAYLENKRVAVRTANGSLQFMKGGRREDLYGQGWEVSGDPAVLDVRIDPEGRWEYGKYKDVFRQLSGAVNVQPNAVVMTARPGYEFTFEASPTHVGGGSHGGISEQEMTVPLVVGGTSMQPQYNRLVDIKQYMIDCLELPHEPG